jgi:hypothetical protein
VTYPRVTTLHGAENIAALFFKDILKLAPIKYKIVRRDFKYCVFGSGPINSPYALSRNTQDPPTTDVPLGYCVLLTRVCYFMAMHHDLRLKGALQATVAGSDFISLKVKSFKDPTDTIQDKKEWRRVFNLLKATLMVLRLADGNKPEMDKLYFLSVGQLRPLSSPLNI